MRSIPLPSRALAAAALLCACAAAPRAHAQLSIEARGGVATPSSGFAAQVPVDRGNATEVSATLGTVPYAGVYVAWRQVEFRLRGSETGVVREGGWAGGVRVDLPTPFAPVAPWVRAGLLTHTVKGGGVFLPARRGTGPEAAGGLRIRLGRGMALTPGVGWTRYTFADGQRRTVKVEYTRVDVGLRFGF